MVYPQIQNGVPDKTLTIAGVSPIYDAQKGTLTYTFPELKSGQVYKTIIQAVDQLHNGDKFYISILGKQLMYEVTGREIINPDQVEKLAIVRGKDKATLLTCEPYTSSKFNYN
ncbi:hypothetical protein BW892_21325 [Bacillus cereus]|uniref:Uncharacterized protein n=1 Tax=Bacillus cereus TaxID=1396 RepID=A0A1S9UI96_BACCE|nr:sortase [Bacillus cereus]OOR21925.1 hypothetical protein BW892_21325 [Bacillus cereus]